MKALCLCILLLGLPLSALSVECATGCRLSKDGSAITTLSSSLSLSSGRLSFGGGLHADFSRPLPSPEWLVPRSWNSLGYQLQLSIQLDRKRRCFLRTSLSGGLVFLEEQVSSLLEVSLGPVFLLFSSRKDRLSLALPCSLVLHSGTMLPTIGFFLLWQEEL